MKQNLVGRILGKIKIFVQDFDTIKTGVRTALLLNISDLGPSVQEFFKIKLLVLYAAYFVVRGEGMRGGVGRRGYKSKLRMTDDSC